MAHMVPLDAAQATPRSPASRRTLLLVALCTVPLLLVLVLAAFELSRLPILDDYPEVLGFAAQLQGHTWLSRIASVFTFQHTQYKLIVGQAIIAVQFGLTRHVHFAVLGLVSNLFIIPLGLVFFAQFLPELPRERRLLLFVPVPFLLYQLTYAESLDWAFGLQTITVVAFALPSLYFITRSSSRKDIAWACLFALLAVFSSINGLLLSVIGAAILLARRQFSHLIVWTLTFALALAVYLHHYSYYQEKHGAVSSILLYVLSFLGSDFETMHRKPFHGAAILVGVLMVALAVYAAAHRYASKRPFMMSVVAWSLMTAIVVAMGRAGMGLSQSLSSRYRIYSSMMLVFCYQYAVEWFLQRSSISFRIQRRMYVGALVFSVCFCIAADVAGMRFLHKRRMVMLEGLAWYLRSPATHSPSTPGADPPDASFDRTGNGIEARILLQQSLRNGDYILPRTEVTEACARFGCSSGSMAPMPVP